MAFVTFYSSLITINLCFNLRFINKVSHVHHKISIITSDPNDVVPLLEKKIFGEKDVDSYLGNTVYLKLL